MGQPLRNGPVRSHQGTKVSAAAAGNQWGHPCWARPPPARPSLTLPPEDESIPCLQTLLTQVPPLWNLGNSPMPRPLPLSPPEAVPTQKTVSISSSWMKCLPTPLPCVPLSQHIVNQGKGGLPWPPSGRDLPLSWAPWHCPWSQCKVVCDPSPLQMALHAGKDGFLLTYVSPAYCLAEVGAW